MKKFLSLMFLLSAMVWAKEEWVIQQIEIKGLERTQEYILKEVLTFKEGDVVSEDDLKNSEQNINNLRFLSVKNYEIDKENLSKVVFYIEEKWTLIPVPLYSNNAGSGVFQFILIESNVLGRGHFGMANYTYKEGGHSGFVGTKLNRLGNGEWGLWLSTGKTERVKEFFLWEKNKEKARWKGYDYSGSSLLSKTFFDENVTFTLGFSYSQLKYEEKKNVESLKVSQENKNSFDFESAFSMGKINETSRGPQGLKLDLNTTVSMNNNEKKIIASSFKGFYSNSLYENLFYTFASNFSYKQILSGSMWDSFDLNAHIRGLKKGVFLGEKIYFQNLEMRLLHKTWESIWLQPVFFVDTGVLFLNSNKSLNVNAIGGGIRLIFSKVQNLAIRVDYAFLQGDEKDQNMSFSMQQFIL